MQRLSPEDRKLLAYHQAGHAVVRWFSANAAKSRRVSINAGHFQGSIDRDKVCTKKMLFDETCALLGGGAGEKLLLIDGDKSIMEMDDNGAATVLAYHQATRYGFSDSLGHLSLDNEGSQGCYGQEIQAMIDNEAKKWLDKAGERVEKLVLHHRELVVRLAELLLQEEVVQYEELVEVLGKESHFEVPKEEVEETPKEKLSTFYWAIGFVFVSYIFCMGWGAIDLLL